MNFPTNAPTNTPETASQICTRRQKNKKFLREALQIASRHLALRQHNSAKMLLRFDLELDARFTPKPMTDVFPEISKGEHPYPYEGPVIVRLKLSNLQEGKVDPLCEWRIAHALGSTGEAKQKLSTVSISIRRFLNDQFGGDDLNLLTKVHSIAGTMILREPLGALAALEGKSDDVPEASLRCAMDSDAWRFNANHPSLSEV